MAAPARGAGAAADPSALARVVGMAERNLLAKIFITSCSEARRVAHASASGICAYRQRASAYLAEISCASFVKRAGCAFSSAAIMHLPYRAHADITPPATLTSQRNAAASGITVT